MILQGAGHDLRGRGATAIDQHDQRHPFAGIGRIGVEAQLGIGDAALGVDDQALGEEVIGNLHRGLQHAAGVVAQVQHQAVELLAAIVLLQLGQRLADLLAGVDLELGDTQVSVTGLQQLALDAAHLDHRTGQLDVERLAAFAYQRQADGAAGFAAHLGDGVHHRQTLGRLPVDFDDQVAGFDAGLGCRRIVDRRHHLDEAVLHADLDAQPAEFAAGAFLQLGKGFWLEIGRVRIEVAEHALDGVFQQGLVIHRLDIGRLDAVQDLGEGAQLVQRQRCLGAWYCSRFRRRLLGPGTALHA